ncbi:C-C motif chemokine 4 homolog [Brachyhypopomus gauderio]|uniref:C-C motif chemokine 4 homolog n=1 Tax=Brachyhypopomus gauderio TaxID=698409 RepID=UPI0040428EE2
MPRLLPRALLLGLLLVACLQLSVMGNNAKGPQECCFRFFAKPIPVKVIVSYEETRSDCPKAGVIFTVKKGARLCVDPGFKWVQNAINRIDQLTVEAST